MICAVELDRIQLRELRKARKITGLQFARLVGVGNRYISQLENGHYTPGRKLIQRMADALGVPVEAICRQETRPSELSADEQMILSLWRRLTVADKTKYLSLGQIMADLSEQAQSQSTGGISGLLTEDQREALAAVNELVGQQVAGKLKARPKRRSASA